MDFKTQDTNLTEISVGQAVEDLAMLYGCVINQGLPLDTVPSAFLWGPPGVGKSQAVREIAEKLERATGKHVCVTDIRLLLFSPIDLRGVPMADENREYTKWLMPKIFDLDPSEDTVNILFLDELSSAPQSLQAAAYQITLDHQVGEHKLPANTIVIAAGNRVTDRSVAFRMPNALANRLMHFEIGTDFKSWEKWAVCHNVNPYVIGYLTFDSSKLYASETGSDDMAFATPRSWMYVSNMLNVLGELDPRRAFPFVSACIGTGLAHEFLSWCTRQKVLADPADVYAGTASAARPKKPDELNAMIAALYSYAEKNRDILDSTRLEYCCEYVSHFPKDFRSAFYTSLLTIGGLKLKLFAAPTFKRWAEENRELIAANDPGSEGGI